MRALGARSMEGERRVGSSGWFGVAVLAGAPLIAAWYQPHPSRKETRRQDAADDEAWRFLARVTDRSSRRTRASTQQRTGPAILNRYLRWAEDTTSPRLPPHAPHRGIHRRRTT